MKIGVNGWRLHGRRTGVGRYLFNVVRYWDRELVGDRVTEINFYSPRPIERETADLPENIRQRVLKPAAPMLVWENLRLGPASRDDVLFCPSYSRPITARRKTVVTLFEATLKLHPEQFPREHWHTLPAAYLALYQWSGRHATLVLTTTEAARSDLTEAYGIDPARIRVVPLAPPEDFRPLPGDPRLPGIRASNVGADVPFFLFVGKMTPRRNVPLLLRAFAELKRKNPALPHRLLVVGLNTVHLDLAALSRELSLGENFAHREYVSDEDLHLLYNAAEAFVLPYSYEALSLTTMEAQANGLPVITVDAPGLREVTGGKAILLPPPLTAAAVCEAMTRIATDGPLRRRLSEEGLEFIRQFSWRRTSRETLAVLEEAAQAAGA